MGDNCHLNEPQSIISHSLLALFCQVPALPDNVDYAIYLYRDSAYTERVTSGEDHVVRDQSTVYAEAVISAESHLKVVIDYCWVEEPKRSEYINTLIQDG